MLLGRLASPAITTKCKQDSLDAEEEDEQAVACLTSERVIDEFESWETISGRFREARSWDPAEAQGRS